MKKFDFTKVSLALTFLIMFVVLCGFMFEQNPVAYKNNPFELPTQVYKQGDVITYKVQRCVSKDTHVTSSQFLVKLDVDGTSTPVRYPLLSGVKDVKKGCDTVDSTPKQIPEFAEEGIYDIESTVTARGTFKNFITVITTIPFQVIGASSTASTTKIIKIYVPPREVVSTTTVITVINTYQTSTPQIIQQTPQAQASTQTQSQNQPAQQSPSVGATVSPVIKLPVLPINIHL